MTATTLDVRNAAERWDAFVEAIPIRPIRSDDDYAHMVSLLDQLLDVVGDNPSHPLAPVLALIGDQIEGYDSAHFAIERSEPREVLRYLMQQHGMKQSDLGDVIAQPNVSAILNGRRTISRDVAKALARRFNVAVDVFL